MFEADLHGKEKVKEGGGDKMWQVLLPQVHLIPDNSEPCQHICKFVAILRGVGQDELSMTSNCSKLSGFWASGLGTGA